MRGRPEATTFWVHTFQEAAADFSGVCAPLCSQETKPENPGLWDGTWIWGTGGPQHFIPGPVLGTGEQRSSGQWSGAVVPGSAVLREDEQPGKQGGQVLADPGRGQAELETTSKETLSCALPF